MLLFLVSLILLAALSVWKQQQQWVTTGAESLIRLAPCLLFNSKEHHPSLIIIDLSPTSPFFPFNLPPSLFVILPLASIKSESGSIVGDLFDAFPYRSRRLDVSVGAGTFPCRTGMFVQAAEASEVGGWSCRMLLLLFFSAASGTSVALFKVAMPYGRDCDNVMAASSDRWLDRSHVLSQSAEQPISIFILAPVEISNGKSLEWSVKTVGLDSSIKKVL